MVEPEQGRERDGPALVAGNGGDGSNGHMEEREREALKTAAEVVVFGWRAADKDE